MILEKKREEERRLDKHSVGGAKNSTEIFKILGLCCWWIGVPTCSTAIMFWLCQVVWLFAWLQDKAQKLAAALVEPDAGACTPALAGVQQVPG